MVSRRIRTGAHSNSNSELWGIALEVIGIPPL